MGGKALKTIDTIRIDRTMFEKLSNIILLELGKTFVNFGIPEFYRNKNSFGDIDVVISMENFNGNMRDYISNTFKPNEIYHNGNCWSFDFEKVQIDFITTTPENFTSTLTYMSGSDAGNYIGKIAHGFGLKYGQAGLTYDHNFKGSNIGRVLISKDYDKIYSFFGLSYNRWKEGFDTLEEIFKFVSESPYFNWEYIQFENNNRINRERDAKRKSYLSFLEYIEKNCKDDNHRYQFEKDKSVYITKLADFFPESNIELEIRRMEYEYTKKLYANTKFNGHDVMLRYKLNGKDLGSAMKSFKENFKFNYNSFNDYIINTDIEQIYSDFETILNINKG